MFEHPCMNRKDESREAGSDSRDPNPESRTPGPDSRMTLLLKGFCMGTADVIPGVSGGTIAFILGIYKELIDGIKSFDLIWLNSIVRLQLSTVINRPHFKFLIPLFSGIIFALLFFTRVIPLPELLYRYPDQVYGLFFGLIAGSCVVLLRNTDKIKFRELFLIMSGILPGLVIFNLGTLSTPDSSLYVFISGCLAISAMLLPGISGSFILLILGKYSYIFNAIGYFKISILTPFCLGMLTGLVVFSRLLSWVLHRYYRATTLIITGILIASLWVIWPFQDRVYDTVASKHKLISSNPVLPGEYNSMFLITVILVLLGLTIVLVIDGLVRKKAAINVNY